MRRVQARQCCGGLRGTTAARLARPCSRSGRGREAVQSSNKEGWLGFQGAKREGPRFKKMGRQRGLASGWQRASLHNAHTCCITAAATHLQSMNLF